MTIPNPSMLMNMTVTRLAAASVEERSAVTAVR
jgi:hypothetical protein